MRYTAVLGSVLLASAMGLAPAVANHGGLKANPGAAAPAAAASTQKTDPISSAGTNHILVTPTATRSMPTATQSSPNASTAIATDPLPQQRKAGANDPNGNKHIFRVIPPPPNGTTTTPTATQSSPNGTVTTPTATQSSPNASTAIATDPLPQQRKAGANDPNGNKHIFRVIPPPPSGTTTTPANQD